MHSVYMCVYMFMGVWVLMVYIHSSVCMRYIHGAYTHMWVLRSREGGDRCCSGPFEQAMT